MRIVVAFALLATACAGAPKPAAAPEAPAAPEAASAAPVAAATEAAAVPEATSFLGAPLFPPPLAPKARAIHEANLAEARARYDASPDDPDAILWLGRRTVYLGRHREAIAIYTRGIQQHPQDARLYRHRGHRYITLRQPDLAIADLQRAAQLRQGLDDQVEPDGIPNAQGIPVSTLHTNIYYHLGLAHYLRGQLAPAIAAYRHCLAASKNDDMIVATTYWLYLALQRTGQPQKAQALLAPIDDRMRLIENTTYHQLLLLFKGEQTAQALLQQDGEDPVANATLGYGIARWYAHRGQPQKARQTLQQIQQSPQWGAFGYIAAEADLAADPAADLGADPAGPAPQTAP